MKKSSSKKIIVCLLALVITVVSMTGCAAKLNGTYKADGVIEQTLTFDGDIVTLSAFGINAEGTYRIEDDKLIITYKVLNLSYDMEMDYEKKGKSIFIDGTEFVKE